MRKEGLKLTGVILLAGIILVIDIVTPLGIAIGSLYILPLAITYWLKDRRLTLLFVALFNVFTIGGLFKPMPANIPASTVIANRFLSCTELWGTAVFIRIARKRGEEVLKQRDQFEVMSIELKQQLDVLNAAAIVSMADSEGKIIYANDLFCKISGYERQELIGQNHRMLKSGVHPQGIYTGMWKAISSGKIWQGEICNRAKDGSFYWVYTTIAPFFNNSGVIDKYVSVRFDITDVKTQEISLRKYADKLKQANDELETFSYSVSHDLRAPLRALEGFSKALLENYGNKLDDDATRWVNFIAENAKQMDLLINEILNFSRVSRGAIKSTVVNMKLLARETFENEKVNYPGKKVLFDLEELPPCHGDPGMLRQVWQNLISNAFKYSAKKNEIHIRITGRHQAPIRVYTISDSGAGFDERYADKLYGVFQRLHPKEEFEGTGVGLAIVHRILQKHGGTIVAKGTPGHGAEFTFTIPDNSPADQSNET